MKVHGLPILTASTLLALLILSCTRHEASTGESLSPRKKSDVQRHKEARLDYLPQISSLSIAGPARALVVTGSPQSTLDLRLTTDGGKSWQVLRSGKQGDAVTAATMTQNGLTWAINRQGGVFTANSPVGSWRMISSLTPASQGDFMEAKQIEFSSETDGWIRDLLTTWHTEDGGNTWEHSVNVLTQGVRGQPTRLFVIDPPVIVATGTAGQIYRSEDGGRTWQIQTLAGENADFTDVCFSDKQDGISVGYVGEPSFRPLVFVTKDGGKTWLERPIGDQVHPWSVSFISDEVWLAGDERQKSSQVGMSTKPLLLHSLDGGLHWERVSLSSADPFFSLVRFADREHGWLVGRDNLYRTDDSGKTWKVALSLAPIQNSSN